MAEVTAREPRVVGLGTVMPGEEGAVEIVAEAFALGLAGIKLHGHVQCFAPDAPDARAIYAACEAADKPVIIHAGRAPASPACAWDRELRRIAGRQHEQETDNEDGAPCPRPTADRAPRRTGCPASGVPVATPGR